MKRLLHALCYSHYENSRIDWAAQGIKAKPQSKAPSTFVVWRHCSTAVQPAINPGQ